MHPPTSYAPNPSKARLALSFKALPFTTQWVDILDIPSVRQGLACPAVRKFDDGSDFYTLPMLQDPSSGGRVIGDSFDIACYLQDTYPQSGGCLFPAGDASVGTGLLDSYESPHKDSVFYAPPLTPNASGRHAAYARFNTHVDTTFSAYVVLVAHRMPFNPSTAAEVRALFARRAHLDSWDQVNIQGEARQQLKAGFREGTASLAALFAVNDSGPYLAGSRASYADLILGGWLNMMALTLPREEWQEFRGWHGGVFGRLHDALRQSCWVCS